MPNCCETEYDLNRAQGISLPRAYTCPVCFTYIIVQVTPTDQKQR